MEEQKLVFDVNGDTFVQQVIEALEAQPVVVDFWAQWCVAAPAGLGPVLEAVATSMNGRVALAKVNVDDNQSLAADWKIRSIPAVSFVNGEVAGEFVGAAPEPEVRRTLEAVLSPK